MNEIDNFDSTIGEVFGEGTNMANSPTSPTDNLTWGRHGAFLVGKIVKEFFTGPRVKPPKKQESRFKFIAEQVISAIPDNADKSVIDTSKELLAQHRTIEDTAARRRLERWACLTIIVYLVVVFILVIINGISRIIWENTFNFGEPFISDTVMYVILSTTTVNIIGLGIIVLKGHFPNKGKEHNGDNSEL